MTDLPTDAELSAIVERVLEARRAFENTPTNPHGPLQRAYEVYEGVSAIHAPVLAHALIAAHNEIARLREVVTAIYDALESNNEAAAFSIAKHALPASEKEK